MSTQLITRTHATIIQCTCRDCRHWYALHPAWEPRCHCFGATWEGDPTKADEGCTHSEVREP
jgi:hypothetical protein